MVQFSSVVVGVAKRLRRAEIVVLSTDEVENLSLSGGDFVPKSTMENRISPLDNPSLSKDLVLVKASAFIRPVMKFASGDKWKWWAAITENCRLSADEAMGRRIAPMPLALRRGRLVSQIAVGGSLNR